MSVEGKICGLVRPEDARVADALGADYLGVVFAPSPRQRSVEQADRIWEGTSAKRAGVFVDASETEVIESARVLGLAVVQLHGSEDPDFCRHLRESGEWAIWKAVRIRSDIDLANTLERYAGSVDGMLLEGWSPKGHGGVGARFDWSMASEIRAAWADSLRMILAGGLTPSNVAQAIEAFGPDVVDVSSGVEKEPGVKDPDAVRAFLEAVRRAAAG